MVSVEFIEIEAVGCGIGEHKGSPLIGITRTRYGGLVETTHVFVDTPSGVVPIQHRVEVPGVGGATINFKRREDVQELPFIPRRGERPRFT